MSTCRFWVWLIAVLIPLHSILAQSTNAQKTNAVAAASPTPTNVIQLPQSITFDSLFSLTKEKDKEEQKSCEWLATILDFLKGIAWPLIVGVFLYHYRAIIAIKLREIRFFKSPLGDAGWPENPAASKSPENPNPPPQNNEVITGFVNKVTNEFLKLSSWNGLKVLYLCIEANKKKAPFNLRQVCESDGSMSYDYAFGYIVASCSALFLKYETPDNVNIKVTEVYPELQNAIMNHIQGRLEFVTKQWGQSVANEYKIQLDKIMSAVATLQPVAGA